MYNEVRDIPVRRIASLIVTVNGAFIIRLQFVHTGVCELHGPTKTQFYFNESEVAINQDLCRSKLKTFQMIDIGAICFLLVFLIIYTVLLFRPKLPSSFLVVVLSRW